jgi:hypothetical protein
MIAVPAITPDTMPEPEPIVATEVLLLLHMPPGVALDNVTVLPIQVTVGPVIGDGNGLTVTDNVAGVAVPLNEPHTLIAVTE